MTRLALSDLLNPVEHRPSTPPQPVLVDVREEWNALALAAASGPVLVSPRTQQGLSRALGRLRAMPSPSPTAPLPISSDNTTTSNHLPLTISLTPSSSQPTPLNDSYPPVTIQHNVFLNRKTTLTALYTYALHTCLEYPRTTASGVMGHLFTMDTEHWVRPSLSFAYSLGRPSGHSKNGDIIYCPLLTDKDGNEVPCFESHSTCMLIIIRNFTSFLTHQYCANSGQGSKLCPFADSCVKQASHVDADREALRSRLVYDKAIRLEGATPMRDIFQKTSAFITALRKSGCTAPPYEETYRSMVEQAQYEKELAYQARLQRGYIPVEIKCDGRLLFDYDERQRPNIR